MEEKTLLEKPPVPIEGLDLLLMPTRNGYNYTKCTENICRILDRHPHFKGRLRFDSWAMKPEIKDFDTNKWRQLQEGDYTNIQRQIQVMYEPFQAIGRVMTIEAIDSVILDHSYNPVEQYFKSLKWDGENRLEIWASMAYGCESNEYTKAVGENFFKAMVKRVLHPGSKFDSVMVLEGKQGCGKTTSLDVIADIIPNKTYHLECSAHNIDKDFYQNMNGKLIIELAEGTTVSSTDTEKMKAVVTTLVDTYRVPYAKNPNDNPRRCVFVMTTNKQEYLRDETGNRRYHPIPVKRADLQWLKDNRDQLFAEAFHRVDTLNEPIHIYPETEAQEMQSSRMVRSIFEDPISDWLKKPIGSKGNEMNLEEGLTIIDVWLYALDGIRSRMSKRDEMQVGNALRSLGWEKKRIQIDGNQKMRWYATNTKP